MYVAWSYEEANARLIAQAPAMLKALIKTAREPEDYSYMYIEIVDIIESATGKAWDEIRELQ
jgi:hypothetical protein